MALLRATYDDPAGPARRRSFRRAALSFLGWELRRGVLEPTSAAAPGSPWWRALNERLLHDGWEAVARTQGLGGAPSSDTIEPWLRFLQAPSASGWYRAPTTAASSPPTSSTQSSPSARTGRSGSS
jgi:hypothetical protein